jgi:NTE family protein
MNGLTVREADLVLEGGGVKGIGLVGAVSVLEEQGYRFRRVAGTSAGAVVGALVAAGCSARRLVEVMGELDYAKLVDPTPLTQIPLVGPLLSLTWQDGLSSGAYLKQWLGERLDELGVRTFGDLRLEDDPDTALAPEQRYRLVVMAADVSQGRLVRLPWDYQRRYGLDPDRQLVVDAVRASTAIPFYYTPVRLPPHDPGKESLLVDGGVLSNFPIDTFDRHDSKASRWPTFGVRLAARPEANLRPLSLAGPFGLELALVATMINAHDQMHLDDPCVLARTMLVDTDQVNPVDFTIDEPTKQRLFANGREAATKFLKGWDWQQYLHQCRQGQ